MKKFLLLLSCFSACISLAQISEGQNFCDETPNGSYFPLTIVNKKIYWDNTFYVETKMGSKTLNDKSYFEYRQVWESGQSSTLYLRKENGIVYQYEECCQEETVRWNADFLEGHSWKTADGIGAYRILTYDGSLKTPYCNYQNLMVIEAKMNYGSYNFYYLKGHGYIGATRNGTINSCVTPEK